ncbi:MAG TPA: DUF2637 domain-containing protein [Trebonia sp.]|nr:DUF2637 domain-containing protein [Trebonia sp.]
MSRPPHPWTPSPPVAPRSGDRSHIYGLGRTHGQDGTAARLLPLTVDGLILAASLVLLHEAPTTGMRQPWPS